jgi:hypothetical protein
MVNSCCTSKLIGLSGSLICLTQYEDVLWNRVISTKRTILSPFTKKYEDVFENATSDCRYPPHIGIDSHSNA